MRKYLITLMRHDTNSGLMYPSFSEVWKRVHYCWMWAVGMANIFVEIEIYIKYYYLNYF